MRNILMLVPFLLLFVNIGFATIWIVDSNPGRSAHFNALQVAHNSSAVQNGDTLYVIGSPISYGGLSLTKMLVIIGPGYFLEANPETQANLASASAGTVFFNAGSEGSVVMGLTAAGEFRINTDSIVVRRNYISGNVNIGAANTVLGVLVTENYCNSCINVGASSSNVIISNNIIGGGVKTSSSASIILSNNVLHYKSTFQGDGVSLYNSIVENNILRITPYECFILNNSIYRHNMGPGGQFGTTNGNQSYVDMGYSISSHWQR